MEAKTKKASPIAACAECKEKREVVAKGLCGRCYDKARRQRMKMEPDAERQIRERAAKIEAALSGTSPQNCKCPPPQAESPSPELPRTDASGGFVVTVDFEPMAYLLETIRKRADAELRDVSRQILWELNKAMGNDRKEGTL